MKIKVSKATPLQLNWLMALCQGVPVTSPEYNWQVCKFAHAYSTSWSLCGPLYEEADCLMETNGNKGEVAVWCSGPTQQPEFAKNPHPIGVYGPTKAIAFCKWWVISKMGDEVEIPEELT